MAVGVLLGTSSALAEVADNTWKDPVSGDWAAGTTDASGAVVSPFWSTGRLPTSTEWVAIDKPGNYFVRLSYLGANSANLAPVVRGMDVIGAGATLGIVRRSLTATEGLNIGPGANLVLARVDTPDGGNPQYGIHGGPLVNDGNLVARDDGSLIDSSSVTNNGTLKVLGGGTYNDGLSYQQSHANLTIANDTDNYGSIVLTTDPLPSGFADALLQLSSGKSLRNKAGAEVRIEPGAGGLRRIFSNLENDGTVAGLGVRALYRGSFVNRAMVDFTGAGGRLESNSLANRFKQEAGTLKFNQFWWPNSHFEYDGGTIEGVVEMVGAALFVDQNNLPSTLTFGPGPLAPAQFLVTGSLPGTRVFGDVPAGTKIWLEAGGTVAGLSGTLTNQASLFGNSALTNLGTIEMNSLSSTGDARLRASMNTNNGTLTNATTGLIDILPGAGGTRSLGGWLSNGGRIRVRATTRIDASELPGPLLPIHENSGVIAIEGAGTVLTLNGSGTFTNLAGGLLEGNGTLDLSAFNFASPLDNKRLLTSQGTVDPGLRQGDVTDTLSVKGNYREGSTASLHVDIGGTAAGGFDSLAVLNTFGATKAELAGTLEVGHVAPFTPTPGQVFRILSTASATGRVGTWSNTLPLDASGDGTVMSEDGVQYTVDYGPNYVDLRDPQISADAGPDQTVDEGAVVTLDGCGDGTGTTYLWEQIAGTPVALADSSACQTTFVAPEAGPAGDVLTFRLTTTLGGLTATDTVDITVRSVNHPPVAVDDDYATNEDTSLVLKAVSGTDLSPVDNDTDADGDTLTVTAVSNATGGSVALVSGTITFTPTANLCGNDIGGFDYTVSDGDGTDTGHVTVDITCVNDPPVAFDDDASGTEDTDVLLAKATLLANDSHGGDGGLLSLTAVANPTGGTVEIAGENVVFHPTANLCGQNVASFEYTVSDGADTDTGLVTIDLSCVNDPPIAADDEYATSEDASLTVPDAGVLGNDSDVDGDALSVTASSPIDNVDHGTLSLNGDGSFTYTPAADYCGPDAFTYRATDGSADSNVATVRLTVSCVNDAPVARDDAYSATEDTSLGAAAPGVLANDSDVEGSTLSVSSPRPIDDVDHGTLTLNPDGSFTYTPTADYCGDDAFTYDATDGTVDSNTATVAITVTCVTEEILFTRSGDIWAVSPDAATPVQLTSGSAFDAEPSWSPDHSKIAFSTSRSGNGDIYVLELGTGALTRLTTSSALDTSPAWSPNGAQIAFASNRTGGSNFEIYVMDAAAGEAGPPALVQVTSHPAADTLPSWSPSGLELAFMSLRSGGGDIYTIPAVAFAPGDPAPVRMTSNTSVDAEPAWSPDGDYIAFSTNRHGSSNSELYVVHVTSMAQTRLTSQSGHQGTPAWSEDGARLAFMSTSTGNGDIYTAPVAATPALIPLAAQTRVTSYNALEAQPDW